MLIKNVKIGEIDYGIDGKEVFYKMWYAENDRPLLQDTAKEHLHRQFASNFEPNHVAGIFVSYINVTKMNSYDYECIARVVWKYDV